MHINQIIILNVVVVVIAGLLVLTVGVLNAQSTLTNAQPSTSIKKRTSGTGSLDILLASSIPIVKKAQIHFKVIFDQNGSNIIQNHIDYDFIITKDSKKLFHASGLAGQAGIPLHTSEGIVMIPYTFQGTGLYLVNVTVYGILFNQINPEYALFPINVTAIS
jgi:hypothetical protein